MPWFINYNIPYENDPSKDPLQLTSSEDLNIVTNLVHHMQERCRESLLTDRPFLCTIFFSMYGVKRQTGYVHIMAHPEDKNAVLVSERGVTEPFSRIKDMAYTYREEPDGTGCIFLEAKLEPALYVLEPNPIPLVYGFSYGTGHIIGKRWYDRNHHWADGGDDENPEKDDLKSVYNYSNEITAIMASLGYEEENGEYSSIEAPDDIRRIYDAFLSKGYRLIYEPELGGPISAIPAEYRDEMLSLQEEHSRANYEKSVVQLAWEDDAWRADIPKDATVRMLVEAAQELVSKSTSGDGYLLGCPNAVITLRAEGMKRKLGEVVTNKGWYGNALPKTYAHGLVPEGARILSVKIERQSERYLQLSAAVDIEGVLDLTEPETVPLAFTIDIQDKTLVLTVAGKDYVESAGEQWGKALDRYPYGKDDRSYGYRDEIRAIMDSAHACCWGQGRWAVDGTDHLEKVLQAFLDEEYTMEYIPVKDRPGAEVTTTIEKMTGKEQMKT